MNHLQFLLLKLSEECHQIGKIASDSAQLGLLNANPEQGERNKVCLHSRLNHLNAIVLLLNESYNLDYRPDVMQMNKSQVKINKDLNHAIGSGMVTLHVPFQQWHDAELKQQK